MILELYSQNQITLYNRANNLSDKISKFKQKKALKNSN